MAGIGLNTDTILDLFSLFGGMKQAEQTEKAGQIASGEGQRMLDEPLTGAEGNVGTVGMVVPEGGFVIPRAVAEYLGLRGGRVKGVDEARNLVNNLRKRGKRDLAEQVIATFNRQGGGGVQTDPGISDIVAGASKDIENENRLAREDTARQYRALEEIKAANVAGVGKARGTIESGFGQVMTGIRADEAKAVSSLVPAKFMSLMPWMQAASLRAEVMRNFTDTSAQAMDMERGAMKWKHDQEDAALEDRLANDPSFAGRPELIENERRKQRFMQREEQGIVYTNLVVQQEAVRSNLDLATAQLVETGAAQTAAGFADLSKQEALLRDAFSARATQAQLDKVQRSLSVDMLEREGRIGEAGFLATITTTYYPTTDALREGMDLRVAWEATEEARRLAAAGLMAQGEMVIGESAGMVADTFKNWADTRAARKAAEAAAEQARHQTELGWAKFGLGAATSLTSAFKPSTDTTQQTQSPFQGGQGGGMGVSGQPEGERYA